MFEGLIMVGGLVVMGWVLTEVIMFATLLASPHLW
jgi:hypothetical protein